MESNLPVSRVFEDMTSNARIIMDDFHLVA